MIAPLCAALAVSIAGSAPGPVLSVSGPIDVGAVDVLGATASATIHVGNSGTGMLQLVDVQIVDAGTGAAADWTLTARAPCSAAIPPACTLTGGQTTDLDLVFDPSVIAVRDATLVIHYTDTADRSTAIPLHGIGRGATLDLVGGQTIFDFGTLPLSTTGALTFTAINRGTASLTGGTAGLTQPSAPFTVSPVAFAIDPGDTATFTISCAPTAAGSATADLQLTGTNAIGPPIQLTLRCAADPSVAVTAAPPAILLGEVRLGATTTHSIALASTTSGSVNLDDIALAAANPALMLGALPAQTPATLALTAAPTAEANLAGALVITPDTGPPISIAISGVAVRPDYTAPTAVSLGIFCVQQPTTSRILTLSSTGSATIALSAPALAAAGSGAGSPFDLTLIAPLTYPARLAPTELATVAVTPKPQTAPGVATDDVTWITDLPAGQPTSPTALTHITASFVGDGGAISPGGLGFGPTVIHLETANAQPVILQNCDVSPIQLDPPQIGPPFSIDSPNFPSSLAPGETNTIFVGFHPTKLGLAMSTLTITSPQLVKPLSVTLAGTGVTSGLVGGDAGTPAATSIDQTSFYACGSCTSGSPTSAFVIAILSLGLLRRRRH